MSSSNHVFSAFSFISFLLLCIPFPWHFQAWNTGTCLFMGWTGLACLVLFVNSVVWDGNVINVAPIWCDVSTRFLTGAPCALLATSLCVNRRLYLASVFEQETKRKKRQHVLVDLSIGLGIPAIQMILQYVVQGHRFDIFEDIGCLTFTYNTPLAYVFLQGPTIAIGLVSAVYGVLAIMAFSRHRTQMKTLLESNCAGLNPNRYLRHISLAGTHVIINLPYIIYTTYMNATSGNVKPWVSWEVTHFDFGRIDQYPRSLMTAGAVASLEVYRWIFVAVGFIFFAFFGFSEEARTYYKKVYGALKKLIGNIFQRRPLKQSPLMNRSPSRAIRDLEKGLTDKHRSRLVPPAPDMVSLKDVGGLLGSLKSKKSCRSLRSKVSLSTLHDAASRKGRKSGLAPLPLSDTVSFQDVGGLLNPGQPGDKERSSVVHLPVDAVSVHDVYDAEEDHPSTPRRPSEALTLPSMIVYDYDKSLPITPAATTSSLYSLASAPRSPTIRRPPPPPLPRIALRSHRTSASPFDSFLEISSPVQRSHLDL